MDYDAMCDELAAIRIQQKQLTERAIWLMARVETFPTVQPVLVAYHYGSEDRDDAMADETDEDPPRTPEGTARRSA